MRQIIKKVQQRLVFQAEEFGLSSKLFRNLYRCTVESTLTNSITETALFKTGGLLSMSLKQHICEAVYPPLQDIYNTRVTERAHIIIKHRIHSQHTLFTLLPSGRRYMSVKTKTTRLKTQSIQRLLKHWLTIEL